MEERRKPFFGTNQRFVRASFLLPTGSFLIMEEWRKPFFGTNQRFVPLVTFHGSGKYCC